MKIFDIQKKMIYHDKNWTIFFIIESIFGAILVFGQLMIHYDILSYISFGVVVITTIFAVYHAKQYYTYRNQLEKVDHSE